MSRGRVLRSTLARYILASCFIACTSVSPKFAKAYPGNPDPNPNSNPNWMAKAYPGKPTDQMVKLGLLTAEEARGRGCSASPPLIPYPNRRR